MAVACGEGFTAVVMEKGDLWSFGEGESGELGLGTATDQLLPASVGVADDLFDGETVVMVAAGTGHTACVTAKGTLWTWGNGQYGRLGHGDREPRQRPVRLGKEMYGGSPAVMVACGARHTLVLTGVGLLSCGFGDDGQLGHGDKAERLVLTLVTAEGFRGAQIVMVAAGATHSVALGAEGRVWTWGSGRHGQLGHSNEGNRLVPKLLAGEALGGSAAVLVSAGWGHTVAVTLEGELWVWGCGGEGQLGLGDQTNRLTPTLVGAESVFVGLQVLTVVCGFFNTLVVTKDGALWTFGKGENGALGHIDRDNRLLPTRIEAQHFDNAKIVCVAGGYWHSAAVTDKGALYTWGSGRGLGHTDGQAKLVPTLVAPHLLQGSRVGCWHDLPPLHALAFAMGTHARLGRKTLAAADKDKDCEYVTMPGELVQRVVEACRRGVPEGRTGKLEGLVRMLGGSMMKTRGST
eukprot:CAMPEP_0173075624 /NCGR_PEP_ID=MMETSP1102-20130122/11796_1 /TAXON_ID=49646 /ORGANISM="Geminigera sp., Strain Caron Lab Isolate" /LENGTH=461 /DNA_ID=CAMNT_0013945065 /DNA_START=123 /DNA_END=1508 /DNA_ORIENTATION=+